MQTASGYIGSLLSLGRVCVRAIAGAREAFLHSLNKPCRTKRSLAAVGMLYLLLGGIAPHTKAGYERYEYDPIGRLIRFLDANNQVTEYTYDAAANILSVVKGGAASGYVPSLTSVTSSFIRRGEVKPIALPGQRLQVGTLRSSDAALDLGNIRQSNTQILADLSAGITAALRTYP